MGDIYNIHGWASPEDPRRASWLGRRLGDAIAGVNCGQGLGRASLRGCLPSQAEQGFDWGPRPRSHT